MIGRFQSVGAVCCLALLAACSGGGGGKAGLRVTAQPAALVALEFGTPWSFQLVLAGADSAPAFTLTQGPAGFVVNGTGRMSWTPALADLGTESIEVDVSDADQVVTVAFDVRVHQGILFGTAYSPLGHDQGVVLQDALDYLTATSHGRAVAYHSNWRDVGATSGEIPGIVVSAMAARDQFGVEPTLVLGWADGSGVADLTSDSEPGNNTWTNAETVSEFVTMLGNVAGTYQPEYLGIANELNIWWASHPTEFNDWLAAYQLAHDAIKLASPNTRVYATFQLEFLKGEGIGWPHGDTWTCFDLMAAGGPMDLAVFTTYPYFEYATPALIPLDHYDEITAHWGAGPVAFSEMGWLVAPSFPYPGDEADQARYVERFFELTDDLDMEFVQWLFLHDVDGQAMSPPFVGIGLRSNDGADIRAADAAWQAAVELRER